MLPFQMLKLNIFLLLHLFAAFRLVACSWGDLDPHYQSCIHFCSLDCERNESFVPYKVPFWQSVPLQCSELCNYGCIKSITDYKLSTGTHIFKYHGHWPFERFFGLEEPASCIFSSLNAVPHLFYILRNIRVCFTEKVDSNKCCYNYMSPWLLFYAIVAVICWAASTLYHAKKTEVHTHFDLISALAFVCFGLFLAVRRMWGITANYYKVLFLGTAFVTFWLIRAFYMLQGLISFNNHMYTCITGVVVTTLIWTIWALCKQQNLKTKQRMNNTVWFSWNKYLCLICQIWLISASALEIFDFPPIYQIFDAHSLWHAATIPLGFLWYVFWDIDIKIANDLLAHEE